MKRQNSTKSRNSRLLLISLLLAFAASLVMVGCTVWPFDSSNATPGPNGPGPGPESTSTVALRPLTGQVLDAGTGKPIAGAEIVASGVLTATAADGLFYFEDVPQGAKLSIVAEGYEAVEIEAGEAQQLPPVRLKADILSGRVTDAKSGKPISGVLVRLTLPVAEPVTPTTPLTITPGVAPTTEISETGSLRSNGLSAPVAATRAPTAVDAEVEATAISKPASTATPKLRPVPPVGDGFVAVYTDDNGDYLFKGVPPGSSLTFKMPGYKLVKTPVDGPKKDVALDEFRVEALYMTANVASVKELYDELVSFALESRFNSVVLNVQTDASEWVFETKNTDALEAGNVDLILPNIADVVADLKSKGIYTIARIVTFQQKTMALARPDWAVMSSVTGKPWRGGSGGHQVWLDASNPAAQDHLVAMTKEVLALGFDEVQYDYVRFPSDAWENEPGKTVFSTMPLTDTGKVKSLQQFLTKAKGVVDPSDAFMSIDVFGYVLWPNQDGAPLLGVIGQVMPDLIDYADYISPMIYPSHFSPGEQGCSVPAKCAYTLIKKAGEYAEPLFAGARSKYRPWLQDFDWGTTDYTSRGTTKVQEQIDACEETNCWGWLMWDPANVYEPRSVFSKK